MDDAGKWQHIIFVERGHMKTIARCWPVCFGKAHLHTCIHGIDLYHIGCWSLIHDQIRCARLYVMLLVAQTTCYLIRWRIMESSAKEQLELVVLVVLVVIRQSQWHV